MHNWHSSIASALQLSSSNCLLPLLHSNAGYYQANSETKTKPLPAVPNCAMFKCHCGFLHFLFQLLEAKRYVCVRESSPPSVSLHSGHASLPLPQKLKRQERKRFFCQPHSPHTEIKRSCWNQRKTTPFFIVLAALPWPLLLPSIFLTPHMCRLVESLSIKSKEGSGPMEPCLSC